MAPAEAAAAFIAGRDSEGVATVAAAVRAGAASLTDAVAFAGGSAPPPPLPQGKDAQDSRERAARLLLTCVDAVPLDSIGAAEEALSGYLETRLHDYTAAVPLLQLSAAVLQPGTPFSDVGYSRVLTAVMSEANVQALSQAARKEAISCVEHAVAHRPGVCRAQSGAFLARFVKVIDGERDPRILLRSFLLHRRVLELFSPAEIVKADPAMLEELFDVVSCYFPIAYQPPRGEVNPVGKSAIKEGVNAAMDHPAFAQFCVPFLLDKLTSPVAETKLDTLEVYRRVCRSYGSDAHLVVEPFFCDFWAQARTEALQGFLREDGEVLDSLMSAVRCTTELIARFDSTDAVHAHLRTLFDGVLNMCSAPEGSMNRTPYSSLLLHACKGSPRVLDVMATRLVPLVHGAFLEREGDEKRAEAVVGVYTALLRAAEEAPEREYGQEVAEQLRLAASTAVSVLGRGGLGADLASIASEGSASAAALRADVVSEDLRKRAIGLVCAAAVGHPNSDTRSIALQCTIRICAKRPLDGAAGVVPGWLGLADGPDATPLDKARIGEALVALAGVDSLRLAVVVALTRRLAASAGDVKQAGLLLAASDIGRKPPPAASAEQEADVVAVVGEIGGAAERCSANAALFDALLAGVQLATAALGAEAQLNVLSQLSADLVQRPATVRCGAVMQLPVAVQRVVCSVLCAMQRDVQLEGLELLAAPAFSGACTPRFHHEPVAAALTKLPAAGVASVVAACEASWQAAAPATPAALTSAGFIARALLMRGDSAELAAAWVQKILSSLTPAQTSAAACDALRSIVAPQRCVATRLHCRSALLWHQRFHTQVLPQLLALHSDSDAEAQPAVFAGVAALLQEAQPTYITQHADALLPLVSQALRRLAVEGRQADPAAAGAAVLALSSMLQGDAAAELLRGQLDGLVTPLLALSAFRPARRVREQSLRSLRAIAERAPGEAAEHKGTVLRGTLSALSDHKRAVRAEATACRNSWWFLRA